MGNVLQRVLTLEQTDVAMQTTDKNLQSSIDTNKTDLENTISSTKNFLQSYLETSVSNLQGAIDNLSTTAAQTYVPKSEFDAFKAGVIWCADGNVCKIPSQATGVQIGEFIIKASGQQACLQNNKVGFCVDESGSVSQINPSSSS